MGWMGTYHHVKYTLRMYGAKFEGENPVFVGEGPAFYMNIQDDNNDVVIGDNCQCLIGNQPASVAALLNSTSYGVRNVRVI